MYVYDIRQIIRKYDWLKLVYNVYNIHVLIPILAILNGFLFRNGLYLTLFYIR
jgi:hypothetical protein